MAKDKEPIRKALAPVLTAMFPKKRVSEAARFGRLYAQGYLSEEAYNFALAKLNDEASQGEASLVSQAATIIRGFFTPEEASDAKRYSFTREIKRAFLEGNDAETIYAMVSEYVSKDTETEEAPERESLSATLRAAVNSNANDSTLFNALKTFEVNQETKRQDAAKAVKAAK